MKYDLEERTATFGESIIRLCKTLPRDGIGGQLVVQLVRSGTSVGANYAEANAASSCRDFRNKIFICKKEAQETKYWLRMVIALLPAQKPIVVPLLQEAHELTLIFQKITSTLKNNLKIDH